MWLIGALIGGDISCAACRILELETRSPAVKYGTRESNRLAPIKANRRSNVMQIYIALHRYTRAQTMHYKGSVINYPSDTQTQQDMTLTR